VGRLRRPIALAARQLALAATVLVTGSSSCARDARADDVPPGCALVSRSNVATCAVGASAAVAAEREGVAAATGRRTAAAPWFPSNPSLSLSMARRNGDADQTSLKLYATLAQEIEIAGQRASRRRAADADIAARTSDVVAVRRRVAGMAYVAYFDALAARDALAMARRLEATGNQVARVTRARADAGVASAVDAEVTEAAALRLARNRLEADRAQRVSLATLAAVLGRDPTRDAVSATGDLAPLAGSDAVAASATTRAARERPEIRALHDEQRAHASRAEAFRRARVPTVTLQIFAENDGIRENSVGAGIALPLPLPQPLGRTYVGEAAESDALARQTGARAEQASRELSGDLAVALATYDVAREQAALFTPERVARTERVIADMAAEIEAGRLAVRDAVVAQQQLMDVLRGQIEVRRALSIASVDLAVAAGVPIEGGAQ
jgi:cobalt-zinc-cadmium efflux system outer membrane protein